MKTVLFVCTGNTCRSPMAEAIARHHLDAGILGRNTRMFVASAGVQAGDGAATTAETLAALAELGIPYDGRSKPLTANMIRKADAVLCMTASQQDAARALVADSPDDAAKVQLLDPAGDIDDPIGLGQDAYDSLGKYLQELIPARLKDLYSKPANHRA